MAINELIREAGETSKAKGFHDVVGGWNAGEKIALMHSELSEALEELRAGRRPDELRFEDGKPEGVPAELADVVIRIFDFCFFYGIDLEAALLAKMAFNRNRPFKHGKNF